ncbi:MAG: hypothetical protein JXB07_02095 [Anaerolineae bacterium]|nr:hypothetical protein [Anaerolineae bacterium]
MEDTYTFIARSAYDPSKVATFTLCDGTMMVDMGSPLENLEKPLQIVDEDVVGETGSSLLLVESIWMRPVVLRLFERVTQPISISDIDASQVGDGLHVQAWIRVGGLRLAPIALVWNEVDNPDATQAFITELNRRKQATVHPGRFWGVLDYWASWLAVGLVVGFLLFRQLQKREE